MFEDVARYDWPAFDALAVCFPALRVVMVAVLDPRQATDLENCEYEYQKTMGEKLRRAGGLLSRARSQGYDETATYGDV